MVEVKAYIVKCPSCNDSFVIEEEDYWLKLKYCPFCLEGDFQKETKTKFNHDFCHIVVK